MLPFPYEGRSREEILDEMRCVRNRDISWRNGRVFGMVYPLDQEVDQLLKEAYTMFFDENGLNPTAFPSLRKFETEVVAMTANILGGNDQTVGTITTGGTESIMMAVKTARDWARDFHPEILTPNIIVPLSAHPAFDKAGHYFNVKIIHIPLREDYRADVEAMRRAITPSTIMMAASAPAYPHGVVDPIADLAAIAQEHNLLFHSDSCVGGYFLPFARELGFPVPDFDLSVPGVTSISADLHKFGYAAKPASVILYKDPGLRRYQFFVYTDWPGGIYPSTGMTGTRAGGPVAAAWALMNYLGREGYLHITDTIMRTTKRIQAGINDINGIKVIGDPDMSVFAVGSDPIENPSVDIYEVADEMSARGWHFDRQHYPASLHVTITYIHQAIIDELLHDLSACVISAQMPSLRKNVSKLMVKSANIFTRLLPEKWVKFLFSKFSNLLGGSGSGLPGRMAPMYGLIGTLPNRGDLRTLVLDLIDGINRYKKE